MTGRGRGRGRPRAGRRLSADQESALLNSTPDGVVESKHGKTVSTTSIVKIGPTAQMFSEVAAAIANDPSMHGDVSIEPGTYLIRMVADIKKTVAHKREPDRRTS